MPIISWSGLPLMIEIKLSIVVHPAGIISPGDSLFQKRLLELVH
jgi:hypothetical protein